VDTGAIDDLDALAGICRDERLWFHVDGACGALAMLAPDLAPRLAGIERADSLAFDFHKWGQVPYDAGFILVRDGVLHRNTFATSAPYLRKELRGLAAGAPWPCDYGPDLSRGFRALKTWFTLKVYGTAALGAAISRTCALARHLESRIAANAGAGAAGAGGTQRGLLPLSLGGRAAHQSADRDRTAGVGVAAPSTTILDGRLAIRAAIVNHRTSRGRSTCWWKNGGPGARHGGQAGRRAVRRANRGCDWPPQRAREAALRELDGRIAGRSREREPAIRACRPAGGVGPHDGSANAYIDVAGARSGAPPGAE
jgi:hypothetical protein